MKHPEAAQLQRHSFSIAHGCACNVSLSLQGTILVDSSGGFTLLQGDLRASDFLRGRFAILTVLGMHVLVAISILSFLVLIGTSLAIVRHIARTRRNRTRTTPAEPPKNLANPL